MKTKVERVSQMGNNNVSNNRFNVDVHLKQKKKMHTRIQSACDEWKCNNSNSFYAHQQHAVRRTYSFRWRCLISLLVVHLIFGSRQSAIDVFVANLRIATERGPRNNECIILQTQKSYIWANYFLNTKIDYEAKQQCDNKQRVRNR